MLQRGELDRSNVEISFFFFFFDHTDANDPRKVIVKKLALCVPGRDDMELDLSGDISKLKKQMFTIKEGVQYKIRIDFLVQREIVHGLKYVQKTYRMCVPGEFLIFTDAFRPFCCHLEFILFFLFFSFLFSFKS